VIAPPSRQRSPWLRRFGDMSDAFASGWMQVRGARRRRSVDRGFVLSDHATGRALARHRRDGRVACDRHPRLRVGDGPWLGEHGYDAAHSRPSTATSTTTRRVAS
jgi:hypothetical protein